MPNSAEEPIAVRIPGPARREVLTNLSRATCYLEYGMGGSTLEALERVQGSVISIESDPAWAKKTVAAVPEKARADFHPLTIDVGPVGQWGYPESTEYFPRFPDYAIAPWRKAHELGVEVDLVLIDGRWRVACFLASLVMGQGTFRVLFDDYRDRPHYHVVEELVHAPRMVGRLAVFDAHGDGISARQLLDWMHVFADAR